MEARNTKSASSKNNTTFSCETELRRLIARNSRRISRVTKGHISPIADEDHIWSIATALTSADICELEVLLRNSDEACKMTLISHLATKKPRIDRKQEKVRHTATRNERNRMRAFEHDDAPNRIRCKVFCYKYGVSKVLFETREAAERYIEYENTLNHLPSGQLFAYYCEVCHGWHISSWNKYKPAA